jgi:hypothetical protein
MGRYDNILIPSELLYEEHSEEAYVNCQTKSLGCKLQYYRIRDGQLEKRVPNYRIIVNGEMRGYRDGDIIEDGEWESVSFDGEIRVTESVVDYHVVEFDNGTVQQIR